MTSLKRQLTLPCLPPAAAPLKRAKRDWNAAEFARALERNGLRPTYGGTYFVDQKGNAYAGVFRANPLRLARRATLAQILRAGGGVRP